MLISKRRIKWGLLLVLVAGVMIFVRPPRTWLDRALVRQIDPTLTVNQVTVYRKDAVVEVDQPQWKKKSDGRSFGLKADRLWLAVDAKPLKKRKIVVAKGQIENALLYFNDYAPSTAETSDVWTLEMDKHAHAIDWEEVKQHFANQLSPEDINGPIRQRIDGWLQQSRDIQAQVQRITSDYSYDDNPLRYEEELRRKIERIDQLNKEHQSIVGNFDGIVATVQQKCAELKAELRTQAQEVAREVINASELQASKQVIAETLMLQIARQSWNQLTDCGQIAQLMAANFYQSKRGEFNVDLPVSVEGQTPDTTFVSVSNLMASGVFSRGETRSPFRLAANVRLKQETQDLVSGVWKYNFFEGDKLIGVIAEQPDAPSTGNEITTEGTQQKMAPEVLVQLKVLPANETVASPSDLAEAAATDSDEPVTVEEMDDSWIEREDYMAKLTASTRNGRLHGILELTTRALDGQPEDAARIIRNAVERSGKTHLSFEVRVSGHWQDPQFVVQEKLPAWLSRSIESEVNQELLTLNDEADAEIKADFDRRALEIQDSVRVAVQNGLAIAESHRQQLITARAMLQRRLQEFDGSLSTSRYQPPTAENEEADPVMRLTTGMPLTPLR